MAILDAILVFHVKYWSNVVLYGLNVFHAPENLEIDTKISKFELTVTDLGSFVGFCGHLGRHLEKKTFPGLEFR